MNWGSRIIAGAAGGILGRQIHKHVFEQKPTKEERKLMHQHGENVDKLDKFRNGKKYG